MNVIHCRCHRRYVVGSLDYVTCRKGVELCPDRWLSYWPRLSVWSGLVSIFARAGLFWVCPFFVLRRFLRAGLYSYDLK